MPTPPSARSIKIDNDERGGWSSDRPRPDGAPPRPPNLSVRCRVLSPSAQQRYSPGSLLLIVSPVPGEGERFGQRLIEDRGALLSLDKVRKLLAGRVPKEEIEVKAAELLDAAVGKRLEASESVALVTEGISEEERQHYVLMAAALKRPCHLILIETTREDVDEAERPALNKLRKALDSGGLGTDGFNTALRLGAGSVGEVKRIVFRPPPKND